MTIIDQRILIPAAPGVVWETISDINKNPHWQVDCQEISFLSSRRQGAGVRWRYVSANRNEIVVETTAWYDGLGYEYTIIDGAPVRDSQGRIRLQEIPEGTIVQWSFNYEPGGLLSGLRNTLSIRRQFESTMVESLKALYTHVKKSGATRDVQEAKSLMRDALDYEARAQYVPRHPSRISEISETDKDEQPVSKLLIPEPPVTDEDTRPNPVLASAEPADNAPAVREPVDLEPAEVSAPPPEPAEPEGIEDDEIKGDEDEAYARFKPPAPSPAADGEALEGEEAEATPEPAPEAEPATPAPEPAPQTVVEAPDSDRNTTPEPPAEETPAVEISADTGPTIEEFGPQLDTSEMDTREITIWEVFGVPRPSDTRPVQTITGEEAPPQQETTPTPETEVSPPVVPEAAPPPLPQSPPVPREPVLPLPYGFRIHARRKRIKIRHRSR